MTLASLFFLALSVAGWTTIFTRAAGPWHLLDRLRVAWPQGPLRCPLCTGTWVGAAAAAFALAAERYPVLASGLLILASAGAGAIMGEGAATLYAVALDLASALDAVRDLADHLVHRDDRGDPREGS